MNINPTNKINTVVGNDFAQEKFNNAYSNLAKVLSVRLNVPQKFQYFREQLAKLPLDVLMDLLKVVK